MKHPKWLFFGGVVVGAVLVIALACGALLALTYTDAGYRLLVKRAAARLGTPAFPSTPAAYDWSVTDFETGEPHSAETLKDKVAFITFWHPGCPFCVATLPHIQQLYEKAKGDGIAFWCVAEREPGVDEADFNRDVAMLAQEYGLTVPMMVLQGKRPEALASRGSPVTFIYAKDGTIAFRYDGGAKWEDEVCLRYMHQLQEQAAPAPVPGGTPVADGAPAS